MMLRTLAPSTPMTVMARRMKGKANCMSASRMIGVVPESAPHAGHEAEAVPTAPATSTADSPIRTEVFAPWTTRLRMSRPSWSVPEDRERAVGRAAWRAG